MGLFSWITQDTNEAIRESYRCSDEYLTTAYMHDNKGNVWEEKKYEGYGVFGGKDFYELLAEMNGIEAPKTLNGEQYTHYMRNKGIDIAFKFNADGYNGIQPNLTRHKNWEWKNEAPKSDPNQGWGE